jgi:hypothetical protein
MGNFSLRSYHHANGLDSNSISSKSKYAPTSSFAGEIFFFKFAKIANAFY